MPQEEFELPEKAEDYEVIPIAPIRKIEKRLEELEKAGTIPQLQSLITQIIELIRGNQRIVEQIVRADTELRNELSKIPPKIDTLIDTMRDFISLVRAAGEAEIGAPTAEALRPLSESLQKLVEQNQKLIDGNAAIIEAIDNLSRKIRAGTPVSTLLAQYPSLKLKREEGGETV